MVEQASPGRSLADKLNHLFATTTAPGGQEYSNEQVAAAISAKGESISQSYIWQLRKGKKDNPTYKHLQALAQFFGVPAAYFFDDAVTDRVDAQLEQIKAQQARLDQIASDNQAQLMAMRAGELSPQRRQQVMDLLNVVYQLERAEQGRPTE